jgi:nucleotide-binding universal stress UspA family protein
VARQAPAHSATAGRQQRCGNIIDRTEGVAMMKVLVPVDGSETALRALRHAMKIADEILLINAQPKADAPALLMHMTQDDIDRVQHDHGEGQLSGARQLLDAAGRTCRAQVVIGEPAAEIARVAHAEGVDMIVMGTHGRGALASMMMGSTATKVVHLADVPVTLVK